MPVGMFAAQPLRLAVAPHVVQYAKFESLTPLWISRYVNE